MAGISYINQTLTWGNKVSKTIYKYELAVKDEQVLRLPADAKILSIQVQGAQMVAWVSLDTKEPERDRKIYIAGTGNPIDCEGLQHLATVQVGPMVWHFFEDQDA